MFKNVASQKVELFAFDYTTGAPKTGDAANITAYLSKDHGAITVLGDTTATEMDATNAKGWYQFDLTQAETNADEVLFTAKSATANVAIVGRPIATFPALFTSLSVDASGRIDIGKLLGTAWLTPGVAGTPDVNVKLWNALTTVALPLIPTVAGRTLDVSATGEGGVDWANVGSPTTVLALTGTTISTSQVVASVSGSVSSVVGNVGGIVAGSVSSVVGNVGGNVLGSVSSVVGNVGGIVAGSVSSVVGNVGGNVLGSVASVVGAVGSVTGLTAANLDATVSSRATPAQILTTALAEAYAADGAAPTLTQLLMWIQQVLTDADASGTTISVKKLDGTTQAGVLTVDNATTPTTIHRTT